MTYNPNVPLNLTTEDIVDSAGYLKTNFTALNTIFGYDHSAFNAADPGKHEGVRFVEQSSDPVTAAEEIALYAKDDGTQLELFTRRPSSGTVSQFTKAGGFFSGIKPVMALNYQPAEGTPIVSQLNVSSVTVASGVYTINISPAMSTANIFWTVHGFSGAGVCYGKVKNTTTYGSAITTTSIAVEFTNASNTRITPTGFSVIAWELQ